MGTTYSTTLNHGRSRRTSRPQAPRGPTGPENGLHAVNQKRRRPGARQEPQEGGVTGRHDRGDEGAVRGRDGGQERDVDMGCDEATGRSDERRLEGLDLLGRGTVEKVPQAVLRGIRPMRDRAQGGAATREGSRGGVGGTGRHREVAGGDGAGAGLGGYAGGGEALLGLGGVHGGAGGVGGGPAGEA